MRGLCYKSIGGNEEAKKDFRMYLELAPKGKMADYVEQSTKELER